MAGRVIIVGVRRGGSLVPSSEIRQMMGRAGRDHEREGVVEFVVEESDIGVIDELLQDGATTVVSSMSNPDLLATAILPDICSGVITKHSEAVQWCQRSFCAEPALDKALMLLKEVEAIGENFAPTELGKVASAFYFHPADVYAWRENFRVLFDQGLENDEVAPAWALGNVPYDRIVGDLGERREVTSECRSRVPLGMSVMKGSLVNVTTWWYLMGGPSVGPLRLSCLERRKDFGRTKGALMRLGAIEDWDMSSFIDDLEIRVRRGITPELLPLCRFAGITKGRAAFLFESGITGPEKFHEAVDKFGDDEIDDAFQKAIETAARECCQASN